MSKFELTFIAPGNVSDKDATNIIDKVIDLVSKNSDKILSENKWGKRMLAYPIKKEQFGYYTTLEFESDGSKNNVIEQALRLDRTIARFLLTRGYEKSVSLIEVEKKADEDSRSAEESLRRGFDKNKDAKRSKVKTEKPKQAIKDESERQEKVAAALEDILAEDEPTTATITPKNTTLKKTAVKKVVKKAPTKKAPAKKTTAKTTETKKKKSSK